MLTAGPSDREGGLDLLGIQMTDLQDPTIAQLDGASGYSRRDHQQWPGAGRADGGLGKERIELLQQGHAGCAEHCAGPVRA